MGHEKHANGNQEDENFNRFASPMISHKNEGNIHPDLRITVFRGMSSGDIKGQKIRNKCIKKSLAAGVPHIAYSHCPVSKLFITRLTSLFTERIDNTYKED